MRNALAGASAAGFTGEQGADADHLKTPDDVNRTAEAGFCFFTIDPSGDVDGHADRYSEAELAERHRSLGEEVRWVEAYRGKTIDLGEGVRLTLGERACARAAVKYGRAVNHAVALTRHIDATMNRLGRRGAYEIELSVDETPEPTTPAEHYLIAHRCLSEGMKLVSLAPRFVGDFEKGVDFKGDIEAFDHSLRAHAAIARAIGPYKLSLHSGSDKLLIYPHLARATAGCFHVKTAGTSYLEALRVVARVDRALFARVTEFARRHYETDRATYHVSAELEKVAPPEALPQANDLEREYLGLWSEVPAGRGLTDPGRQILHTTYGSVLTDGELGPAVKQLVRENAPLYRQILCDHFSRHLDALCQGQ
jgi:hypothetical protein